MPQISNDPMPFTRLKNVLRLLGAGLFVFIGLGLSVFFISRFFPDALPAWIVVPLLVGGFFVFIFLAMVLFHGKGPRRISAEKSAARLRKLEEDGLLIPQIFRARRAFQVDEFASSNSLTVPFFSLPANISMTMSPSRVVARRLGRRGPSHLLSSRFDATKKMDLQLIYRAKEK
jgi:hypothetical protein